jgi:hypothetical protein
MLLYQYRQRAYTPPVRVTSTLPNLLEARRKMLIARWRANTTAA